MIVRRVVEARRLHYGHTANAERWDPLSSLGISTIGDNKRKVRDTYEEDPAIPSVNGDEVPPAASSWSRRMLGRDKTTTREQDENEKTGEAGMPTGNWKNSKLWNSWRWLLCCS